MADPLITIAFTDEAAIAFCQAEITALVNKLGQFKSAPGGDDGWIPWSGGECPVGPEVRIDVQFRDGGISLDMYASVWSVSCWQHDDGGHHDNDIMFYRLHTEAGS